MEQPVDVVWTEILQPLKPDLLLRYAEPLAIVGLLVGARFQSDAIEADRDLQQAVFRQISEIAPGDPPALLDLLQAK